MATIFDRISTVWVRYDNYTVQTADNGRQYLTPAEDATPEIVDPLENAKKLVLDAINIGLMVMGRHPRQLIEQELIRFAGRYGLLGLMTALPTTARFMDYSCVYLPKNDYIREESMETQAYTDLFFPFRKPTYRKEGDIVEWDLEDDLMMQAMMLTFADGDAAADAFSEFLASDEANSIWQNYGYELAE